MKSKTVSKERLVLTELNRQLNNILDYTESRLKEYSAKIDKLEKDIELLKKASS